MRDTINMIGFGAGKNRFWNHLQGCCGTPGQMIFSRNGTDEGQLIFTKNDNFDGHIEVDENHVGGIDQAGPYVAVPCYNSGDTYGMLRIYHAESRALVACHRLPHRIYAAGIAPEKPFESGTLKYLIALVASADGRKMAWYRWFKNEHRFAELVDKPNAIPHDLQARPSARNNIMLSNAGDDLYLYSLRAHVGYGTIHAFKVDMCLDRVQVALEHKYHSKKRTLFCSARFAATLYEDRFGYRLLRTARNIFFDRLVYRTDRITLKESSS